MTRKWVQDAFAIGGLACLVGWLVLVVRSPMSFSPPETVLFIAVMVCAFTMWAWMLADCVAAIARGRTGRLVFWLALMFAFWPSAYAYYFLVRRRRATTEREGGGSQVTSLPPDP